MKQSSLLRQHTYRTLIDWRTDCKRLQPIQVEAVTQELSAFLKHASFFRITAACQPVMDNLDRIQSLLQSLRYVVILIMLLFGNTAEARHVHHTPDVVRSVRIYDPPRVEVRPVRSVFDMGTEGIEWPYFDISFLLGFDPRPIVFPVPKVPVIPEAHSLTPDYTPTYARMLVSAGVITVLTALFFTRMTGQPYSAVPPSSKYIPHNKECTLVETRWYLPLWVSTGWCHLKHKLMLR